MSFGFGEKVIPYCCKVPPGCIKICPSGELAAFLWTSRRNLPQKLWPNLRAPHSRNGLNPKKSMFPEGTYDVWRQGLQPTPSKSQTQAGACPIRTEPLGRLSTKHQQIFTGTTKRNIAYQAHGTKKMSSHWSQASGFVKKWSTVFLFIARKKSVFPWFFSLVSIPF